MKNLIILHGWQSSKEKWQIVKEDIEKAGIRVYTPDIPGFKPDNRLTQPWNLDNYIEWFYQYVSDEKIPEGYFLLGHSFGGRMTIKIAADRKQKPKGVILVSAAGIKREPNLYVKILAEFARIIKELKIEDVPLLKSIFKLSRSFFYKYILRRTDYYNTQGFLKDTIKNVLNEDLTSRLDKINTPTLIVWGKEDKVTPLEDAYLMKSKIKHSKLELLDRVGHTPYKETPIKLAQLVTKFIEEN